MSPFHGLCAFPPTPLDAAGRVDAPRLAALVEEIAAAGADSIGVLGSTGAYPYLDRAERRRAVEVAARAAAGRLPVLAGIGALSTRDVLALAADARAAGAAAALLAPVSYQRLTAAEVFCLFSDVAGATDLPICIYSNPATTGFTFDAELLARLAELPGVAAVKLPPPAPGGVAAELAALSARIGPGLALGYSGDWIAAEALGAGAAAWYSVIAGVRPRAAMALARAARDGDAAALDRLAPAFDPLWDLFRAHGSYRVAHAVAGLIPPRPVLPLGPAARPALDAALARIDALA